MGNGAGKGGVPDGADHNGIEDDFYSSGDEDPRRQMEDAREGRGWSSLHNGCVYGM